MWAHGALASSWTHVGSSLFLAFALPLVASADNSGQQSIDSGAFPAPNPHLEYRPYAPTGDEWIVSRTAYADKLHGFWLGQSIANWTGLVTEMDKIGNIGAIKTGDFYTREDWGKPDQPSIWGQGLPSELSPTIDFVFRGEDEVWGADDDTDIEYIYQHLLYRHQTSVLTGEQIRQGWLEHIYDERQETPYGPDEDGKFQNYLWVSNQAAHELMLAGRVPPETSEPELNPHWEMIDAQLTTEIFGLYAPNRTDFAMKMAYLPIRATARGEAAEAAEFYVTMHALAANIDPLMPVGPQLRDVAEKAREGLPERGYLAHMYDYVVGEYRNGVPWEQVRDGLYRKYQLNQEGGYDLTSRNLYCNGCFASGINFAAGLVSLFYGEGNLQETIRIGALCGWDSDNPTATWGGLLGFVYGKQGVERAFGREFSSRFDIHRTRRGFADNGIDSFKSMAERGVQIVDRVVQEDLAGGVNLDRGLWYIPRK